MVIWERSVAPNANRDEKSSIRLKSEMTKTEKAASVKKKLKKPANRTISVRMLVDSESVTHNMWVLLMFRSVMVHTKGIIDFLGRTISSSKHLICQHIMCNRLGV